MAAPANSAGVLSRRRSHRFQHRVPLILSSPEAAPEFYERCETTDVSSHGCQVRSPRKLAPGQKVHLQLADSARQADARVTSVRPDAAATGWEIGLELSEPGNLWGLRFSPHMFPWPADVSLPPLGAPAGPASQDSAPAPTMPAAGRQTPGAPAGEALKTLQHLQDEHRKEFETRIQETLRGATNQLTKNVQFALDTLETSLRELTDSSRQELEEWLEAQRAELDQKLLRLVEAQGQLVVEDVVTQLRDHTRAALTEEVGAFRARLREALETGLEAAANHLAKGKK